jgi:hypothetical protein
MMNFERMLQMVKNIARGTVCGIQMIGFLLGKSKLGSGVTIPWF